MWAWLMLSLTEKIQFSRSELIDGLKVSIHFFNKFSRLSFVISLRAVLKIPK